MPTVLVGAHPSALYCATLFNALKPKTKFISIISIIGSYRRDSKMMDRLTGLMGNVKAEILEPVSAKGLATEESYSNPDEPADNILVKHRDLGIV